MKVQRLLRAAARRLLYFGPGSPRSFTRSCSSMLSRPSFLPGVFPSYSPAPSLFFRPYPLETVFLYFSSTFLFLYALARRGTVFSGFDAIAFFIALAGLKICTFHGSYLFSRVDVATIVLKMIVTLFSRLRLMIWTFKIGDCDIHLDSISDTYHKIIK